jgi:hypothetical protein
MQKGCTNCPQPAECSIVVILSTVGVSPRLQKSSAAILFCYECFEELSDTLCSDALRKAVNNAYTEQKQHLHEHVTSQKSDRR